MRVIVVIAVALTAALCVSAQAQERCFDKAALVYVDCLDEAEADAAPDEPPLTLPPEPSQPWSGVYLGAHAGGAFAESAATLGGRRFEQDPEGPLAGGQAGFLKQYDGDLVLGLETDFSKVWAGETASDAGSGLSGETRLDWLASSRLRLGVAMEDCLPYLTGGIALARWERRSGARAAADVAAGPVLGAGVEMLAEEHWLVRAEGLYYVFDEDPTFAPETSDAGALGDVMVGRVGLSYKW